jgi:hypothetical protein
MQRELAEANRARASLENHIASLANMVDSLTRKNAAVANQLRQLDERSRATHLCATSAVTSVEAVAAAAEKAGQQCTDIEKWNESVAEPQIKQIEDLAMQNRLLAREAASKFATAAATSVVSSKQSAAMNTTSTDTADLHRVSSDTKAVVSTGAVAQAVSSYARDFADAVEAVLDGDEDIDSWSDDESVSLALRRQRRRVEMEREREALLRVKMEQEKSSQGIVRSIMRIVTFVAYSTVLMALGATVVLALVMQLSLVPMGEPSLGVADASAEGWASWTMPSSDGVRMLVVGLVESLGAEIEMPY